MTVRRLARWLVVLALVGGLALVAGAVVAEQVLWSRLGHVPSAFAGLDHRPRPSDGGALNYLVVQRGASSDASWVGGPADALMVVHVNGSRSEVSVIGLPLTARAEVPGHGVRSLDDALRVGGPSLAVQTVEDLTGVRVDHVAVVSWQALARVVDGADGIDVDLTRPKSIGGYRWREGRNHIGSELARVFLDDTTGLPRGEVDRVERVLAVLRGVVSTAVEQEMRYRPDRVFAVVHTLATGSAIDDTASRGELRGLAWSLRGVRSGSIVYAVAPMTDPYTFDEQRTPALWTALRDDGVADWRAGEPDLLVPIAVE